MRQHLQALEQRVAELEDENQYFRNHFDLPPSSRPQLGGGPTGIDQPYRDADNLRPQTISPSMESAGSSSSITSSPELGNSLIPPSTSPRTMTMDAGPSSQRTDTIENERHTSSTLSRLQSDAIGQSIPTLAPIPFKKTPTSYSPTSEVQKFIGFKPHREARSDDDFCGLDQNSEQYRHTRATQGASVYPQSYHDSNPIYCERYPLPPDHVHTSEGLPESRRFPWLPEQAYPSYYHTDQHLYRKQQYDD
jgi:hypothetical protein